MEVVGHRRKVREALDVVAPADGGGEGEDIHVHIHDAAPEPVSLNGSRAVARELPENIGPPEGAPWRKEGALLISVFSPEVDAFHVVRKTGDGGLSVWRRGRDGRDEHVATFGSGHHAETDSKGTLRVYRDAEPSFPGPRARDPERPEGWERRSGELELTSHGPDGDRHRDAVVLRPEDPRSELSGHEFVEVDDEDEPGEHVTTFPGRRYDARRERDRLHVTKDDRPHAVFKDTGEEMYYAVPARDGLAVYRRPRRDRRPRHARDSNRSSRCDSIGLQQQIDAMWAKPENRPQYMNDTPASAPVRDAAPRRIKNVRDLQAAADELWKREKS